MSVAMNKELSKQKKLLHPNSRKVVAIVKKGKKVAKRNHAKQMGSVKQILILEKMMWLKENMIPNVCPYTPELTGDLLEKYIARNDQELQLIVEKNKVKAKKNQIRSNAGREDVLRMNKERELDEYNGSGIEIPDILNSTQCEMLRKWDGDVRYLSNFIFRRFGKKHLQQGNKTKLLESKLNSQDNSTEESFEKMDDDDDDDDGDGDDNDEETK